MKEEIKELRVKIDGLAQLTKELKSNFNGTVCNLSCCKDIHLSKETEDCFDSLIYAKAWLGKVLGELGSESPYKAGYKTVEDIEPTADKPIEGEINPFTVNRLFFQDFNYIEKVDWLRTEIEKLINEIKQIGNAPNPPMLNREISIARTNAYNHLCEARFALGFELERIKLENK